MNTKGHPFFDENGHLPLTLALNHVQSTSHAPLATASVNQGVVNFSRATLKFLRLRMRWPQRVRTVRILRMSECKRGCGFLQFLQGPGFSQVSCLRERGVCQWPRLCTEVADKIRGRGPKRCVCEDEDAF
jgi:hypothetical protein